MQKIVYQTAADGAYVGPVMLSDVAGDVCPITGDWLIPGGCIETVPPEPGENQKAIWKNGEWVLEDIPELDPEPVPTLAELQAAKWANIKERRDTLEQSGLPYMGKVLDSDILSVQRIAIAVQAAQAARSAEIDFTVDWTCADNSVLTMTAEQVVGIPVALAQYSDNLHQIARGLREQIEAAQTAEELAMIIWPE